MDRRVEALFRFVFRVQQERPPLHWEEIIGLALLDGTLTVNHVPEVEELRRVHHAAALTQAACDFSK